MSSANSGSLTQKLHRLILHFEQECIDCGQNLQTFSSPLKLEVFEGFSPSTELTELLFSYRLAKLLFRVSTLFGRSYILLTFLDFFLERDSFNSFMPGFTQFSKKLSLSAIFFDLIFSYSLSDTFKISSVPTPDSFCFSPYFEHHLPRIQNCLKVSGKLFYIALLLHFYYITLHYYYYIITYTNTNTNMGGCRVNVDCRFCPKNDCRM